MAVVVIYFHKLNPFSKKKTEKQRMMTIQLWIKVIIGTLPAMIVGFLFNDFIEAKLNNAYVVAAMLILYGILFIVIENQNKTREPKVVKLSQLSIQTVLLIGVFPDACYDTGNIEIWRDDRGSSLPGSVKSDCDGVYILPCDPSYVCGKRSEIV